MPPTADRLALSGAAMIAALAASAALAGTASSTRSVSRTSSSLTEETAPVRYDRDIRPLLSDRCFKCHGPDSGSRQANLRLDRTEGATAEREGVRAFVPGDLAASELWRRVSSHDDAERMPPQASNKRKLSEDELDLVRRWIEQGATYEEHWSFVPPVRPAPPRIANASWPRGEIDQFVLSELERRGIAPSP